MDIQPTNQQPMSDDQELAKVLAGITAGADASTTPDLSGDSDQASSTPALATDDNTSTPPAMPPMPEPSMPTPDPVIPPAEPTPLATPSFTPPSTPSFTPPTSPVADSGLEAIKHDALNELRPLVDKLNLSAEEKFDTYLLLIRSTDDPTLVSPAFEAARTITDESEKAQALLDIVKEIDYLSNTDKQTA